MSTPHIRWGAIPIPDVPDWTPQQAYDGRGSCGSCGRVTWLRADPLVFQKVCRPCWEALMFGDDDEW